MVLFLTLATAVMVLLALGTVDGHIPILSSVANAITVTGAHIYLVVQVVILTLALTLDLGLQTGCTVVLVATMATCIAVQIMVIRRMLHTARAGGVAVNFFKAYWPDVIRGIQTETVTYGPLPNSVLKVFYTNDGRRDKPVIIYTHGGGWFYGSKDDRTYYHKHFAQDGYVVVSIDYTLSDRTNHYAGHTETQLTQGLDWVLTNIHRFNGRCSGWAFAGDSAGGNLALNLAFKINAHLLCQPDGSPYPEVRAVSVTYPVADPVGFYHNPDPIMGAVSRYSASAYTGGTPELHPEVYAAITPANFLSAHTPPVCIVMGNQDAAVPPAGALALIDHINSLGILTKVINLPHANHACDTFWGSIASQTYIGATRRWFATINQPALTKQPCQRSMLPEAQPAPQDA